MKEDRREFLKILAASAAGLGLSDLVKAEDVAPANRQSERALEAPFTFAVVADPHCAEKARWKPDELGSHVERFFRCVAEMEKLDAGKKPDFMLIVGDIHMWELRKHFDRIHIPMHVIAGNHESGRNTKKKELRDLFPDDFQLNGKPADYYSFVHKGMRFIGVCNAGLGGEHIGQLASEDFLPRGQCEWLEGQLAREEAHKIVFAHIPPHPEGEDRNMFMSRNDSRYFNALIERAQPTAMFFGHQHNATRERRIGRTRSFTLRSCCWNGDRTPLGFALVDVTPSGISVREVLTS